MDRRFKITIALASLVVVLGLVVTLLFINSTAVVNGASIFGVALSLAGFGVTIFCVSEAQKATREAKQAVQEAKEQVKDAVERSQRQVRESVERTQAFLLFSNHSALLRTVREVRTAIDSAEWERARHRLEDCPALATRLAAMEGLLADEVAGVRRGGDELRNLGLWLRQVLPVTTLEITPYRLRAIERLIRLLEQIEARLHREVINVPDITG